MILELPDPLSFFKESGNAYLDYRFNNFLVNERTKYKSYYRATVFLMFHNYRWLIIYGLRLQYGNPNIRMPKEEVEGIWVDRIDVVGICSRSPF